MTALIGNKEMNNPETLVYTIKERCRVCYTCVRECPAKAIKITGGQAEVISKRCIACGNCIRVCSQGAKVYRNSIQEVQDILKNNQTVVACVAPSFPAEFHEITDHKVLVGMIKKLGFAFVNEVSFGADLVAYQYKNLINSGTEKRFISSDCPAIVTYVEKYHPELITNLAPIVSPMVALTRVLKIKHGENIKIVFIGPCIAKKEESSEVDAIITFRELREMFRMNTIQQNNVTPVLFDEPKGGKGAIFPVSRGLVQTIEMNENIHEENIIVADGRINFQEAIKEFDSGLLRNQHLELLCCEGCVMGVGMTSLGKPFAKRTLISNYVHDKLEHLDEQKWKEAFDTYKDIDLVQTFESKDMRVPLPHEEMLTKVLNELGKFTEEQHLNCGACGYDTCREHAIAIINGLAEDEMCLPFTIEKLHNSVVDLALSNKKLASVQQALRHNEKLAHMGQLSAGIAHELNNPLGVIIMYSNLLLEDLPKEDETRKDLELIVQQAERCKNIVSGLLNFARKNKVNSEQVDVNELIELSISSIIIPENVSVQVTKTIKTERINVDKEQMIQALSNLIKNAVEAMIKGGTLNIQIMDDETNIHFTFTDSGMGIKKQDMERIFNPFFTTKEIGKGTGLGLATTYGIIKMHKGKISVTSNADVNAGQTGTTFKVTIPINN